MKKLYLVLSLFLLVSSIFAQPFKLAWITDIHIGYPKADEDLRTIVKDINHRSEIQFVIVTGDIAEKGRNDELELAKRILDSLNIKYYIIPGNHDTKWSESACSKFIELWKDDKFAFEFNGTKFIGLCSGIPWRGGGGHISPEDLKWLDESLKNLSDQQEIIYLQHHQLDSETDNWFKVTNRLRNYNIIAALVGHGHANKFYNFNGMTGIMGRSTLNRGGSWGYTLVESKTDSLLFYEINKDSIPVFWGGISKIKKNEIPVIDSLQFNNFSSEIIFQKEFNHTFVSAPVVSNEKIYTCSRGGVITCFDLNGKQLWEYKTFSTVFSRPVISNDIIVIGTATGDLITLNAATGEQIQTIGIGEVITSQLITFNYAGSKLLMTGQKPKSCVLIGTGSGKLYCYDLESLEPIWENELSKSMIETRPLFFENKIIYGSWDGIVYCVDARSGVLIWKWSENKNFYYSNAACVPVTDGKNVFVTSPDKSVSAIDLLQGRTVWRKTNYNSWESIGISRDKKFLLIKTMKDKFIFVNAKDGSINKEVEIKFDIDTMPVELEENNGNVIFGLENGLVYNIKMKNYNTDKLFYMGTSRVLSVQNVKENIYCSLNMDGTFVIFKLL